MKEFYIRLFDWGEPNPQIIDDEAMYQAERGMNYLNPNEFDFLCEAETEREAEEFYINELSKDIFEQIAESTHP